VSEQWNRLHEWYASNLTVKKRLIFLYKEPVCLILSSKNLILSNKQLNGSQKQCKAGKENSLYLCNATSNCLKRIAICIILLSLPAFLHKLCAQGYYFRHYQVENGLSNNTVFSSIQDKKGFIWLGTKDGANRFDGISFKVFRHDPSDSNSLGNDFVVSLYETPDSVLLAGTQSGLYRFDETTEGFTLIKGTDLSDVRDMVSDNNHNLWFVMGLHLYRYNEKKDSLPVRITDDSSLVSAVCSAPDGSIWAATPEGQLRKYTPGSPGFTAYDLFHHSPETTSKWIEEIYDTGKGIVLAGTSNQGIKAFNTANNDYKDVITYNPDRTEVYGRDFIHYAGDEYWVATESGIFIYNIKDGSYRNLRKNYSDPYSISDNAVYSLCRDKEGGLWAGTYFGGVNYYPHQYTSFQKFFPDNSDRTISGNAVREICGDGYGNLWIGTEDKGLDKLNLKTGKITTYLPTGSPNSIAYTNIHGLLVVHNELWIGTFEHGLDVMDIPSGKIIRHYAGGGGATSFRGNFVLTLCQTRQGEILAGTPQGIFRYNKSADRFFDIPQVPTNIFVYSILEDYRGTIWVTTIGQGIYYYNPATGEKGSLLHDPHNTNSINSDIVNNVFEDSYRNLWFATEGSGLCRYNHQTKTYKRYTTTNGLPSNFIFRILEDGKRNLWISTSRGLVCFNPVTESIKVYTRANGLLNDQFNYNSGFKDSTGRMYFGSVKGMISFNPDEFTQSDFITPVYITGFQVNNKELSIGKNGSALSQSILTTSNITLPYDQSSFSIDFAALSFTAPGTTEYAYKMEGLDKDWTFLKTNRKVYFTSLSPGTYTFTVKAANSSGSWNTQQTRLTIQILPPFWASPWAYLLYVLIGAGIILYLIRNYHIRTEEKNKRRIELLEHEKEKELYQAKIEFFTNVAHEIKTPLTLIKGPMEKVIKRAEELPDLKNNLRIMERNTNRLIDLTNQLLDFRQTETKGFSLSFTRINISELLEETFANFRSLAEEKTISYTLDMPGQPLYVMADIDAMNKILSNLFSNAVKYADSSVSIKLLPFTEEDITFTIETINDGHLVPYEMKEKIFEPFFRLKRTEKQKGTGIGLALARSLAELHKGTLYLQESNNGLNVFVLNLPLQQEKTGTTAETGTTLSAHP
jgi:signal transduction histidine kinase/ligand-binding sensor domain-containing protein